MLLGPGENLSHFKNDIYIVVFCVAYAMRDNKTEANIGLRLFF